MKETWTKPQVTEQEVGLEVTSYVAAESKTPDILQPTNSTTDCCGPAHAVEGSEAQALACAAWFAPSSALVIAKA